jgi:hypothetical protein
VSGFVAAILGVLVAPGLRGLATDRVVNACNRLAWTFGYFVAGLLVTAIVLAALELARASRLISVWSGFAVGMAGLAVTLSTPALLKPLPPIVAAALAVVTAVTVIAGGAQALRAKHTRAVGAVMLALALAGLLRVSAWDLARMAGDAGNTRLYTVARLVATGGLLLEAVAQMIAAAWLGTRSRVGGQLLSSVAVAAAWVLTASASAGASASAHPWQVAAHIAVTSAFTLPQPLGPGGLAVFLLAGSIFLAGVAAAQRRQVVAVVVALSLSLLGRGAFDVPLHALAASAASLWIILAVSDERSVWRNILEARNSRPPRSPGPPPSRV